jgi:hypothetical protein
VIFLGAVLPSYFDYNIKMMLQEGSGFFKHCMIFLIVAIYSISQITASEVPTFLGTPTITTPNTEKPDFQLGLQYFILHQQGVEKGTVKVKDDSHFDLAKKHLTKCATLSYTGLENINEQWQALYLLGDLLQRSPNVSN